MQTFSFVSVEKQGCVVPHWTGFRIGQKNNRTIKDNNVFSTENNGKYDTIQPMKHSVQQEVRPYPKNKVTDHVSENTL